MVVWNHGSAGAGKDQDASEYGYQFATYYFLSRGYAVALPFMRGYNGSESSISVSGCNFSGSGLDNARDILAVAEQLAEIPQINAERIIVGGQSFGGWNALAVGTLQDSRVVGIVNFAGGITTPVCRARSEALRSGAKVFGGATRVPSLWLYGDNDRFTPPVTWRAMHAAYSGQGGKAELVAYGSFLADSHTLLSYPESVPIISPKLDAFLAKAGLPTKIAHPEYLPVPWPAPTRFAAIDDVQALPFPHDAAREIYRRFLMEQFPRAFVMDPGKTVYWSSGNFDPLGKALAACHKSGHNCRPYAIDGDVVWQGPPSR